MRRGICSPMKKITVIRHGMPAAHDKYYARKLLKGSDITNFINDWNSCELSPANRIPNVLRSAITDADKYISSGLKRSIASMRLLGIKDHDSLILINEAEMPHGFLKNIAFPLIVWEIIIRTLWIFGYKKNAESYSSFKERIGKAYAKIAANSKKFNHIVVMGHGFANMQLKKELKRHKWNHVKHVDGRNYWSFDSFEKP